MPYKATYICTSPYIGILNLTILYHKIYRIINIIITISEHTTCVLTIRKLYIIHTNMNIFYHTILYQFSSVYTCQCPCIATLID